MGGSSNILFAVEWIIAYLPSLLLHINLFFKQFQGVRSRASDACASNNPCQNGGKCIATDNGPLCDCGKVDFSGIFCQQGKSKLLTKLQYILHTILRLFNIVVCRIDFQFQGD